MARRNGLPANVSEFQDRHGKWRLRYRAKGQPTYYFKGMPGTELFREELDACRARKPSAGVRTSTKTPPGSISALIALYYGTAAYTGLAASSRKTYRSVLERFRAEHGQKSVANFERRHIKTIIGAMSATPAAANKLLDKIKILMSLAVDEGWRASDPTQGVKGFRIKTEGFHTWSEEEIAAFDRKYPLGTRARLAKDVHLFTGQRRSDGVRAGRQHISADGRISVAQQKTSKRLSIRLHSKLQESIAAGERAGILGDLTFIVTEDNKPFTANGFGNKMREWCDAAGLPECTSHGLRKAAARRLAEAGCTNQQIKAITGHTTDAEVARYTAAANQKHLADQAMDAIDIAEVG